MIQKDYEFLLLGNLEPVEPFLSYDLSKNGRVRSLSAQELPLNDPGIVSAFLTVTKHNAVFYGPFSKKSAQKTNLSFLNAAAHALRTEESILVSWFGKDIPVPEHLGCTSLLFKLPETVICPGTKNFVNEWIEKLLTRKKIRFKETGRINMITNRLLSQMTCAAVSKCLANPELAGTYELSACGQPTKAEAVSFIRSSLERMLPGRQLAEIDFQISDEDDLPPEELTCTEFMMNFEILLPSWQTEIEESIADQAPYILNPELRK